MHRDLFRWVKGTDKLSYYASSPGKPRFFCSNCGSQLVADIKDSENSMLCVATHKASASFCDYFEPKPNAYQNKETKEAANARAELAALFGDDK